MNCIPLERGDHLILPYAFGKVELEGDLMLIASTVGDLMKEERKCTAYV